MSKTEHRISYKAGITRRPSDFLCEDGELAECINLTTDNEELKVVSQPELFMTVSGVAFILLYVHTVNGVAHFIGYERNGSECRIRWGVRGNDRALSLHSGYMTTVSNPDTLQITSIGNFLILSDGTTMSYFLWKVDTGDYVYQSNKIPEPKIEFAMVHGRWQEGNTASSDFSVYYSGEKGDCMRLATRDGGDGKKYLTPEVDKQEAYNDLVIGLYSKCLKGTADIKCFARPFFVRYALELYDGSYTNISNPILLLPALTCNCLATYKNDGTVHILQ